MPTARETKVFLCIVAILLSLFYVTLLHTTLLYAQLKEIDRVSFSEGEELSVIPEHREGLAGKEYDILKVKRIYKTWDYDYIYEYEFNPLNDSPGLKDRIDSKLTYFGLAKTIACVGVILVSLGIIFKRTK